MRKHHYALGAALLLTLALPWQLAAAVDLNAPIDMQAVQLQPQEQNGIRWHRLAYRECEVAQSTGDHEEAEYE